LVDAILDAGEGKVTMNLNGTKYTYNFLRVSKHPTPFPPEDEEVEEIDSLCFVETLRDPLQRAMENQISNQQDEELEEATKGLEPHDGSVEEGKFEDIGEIKPEEPKAPEVDLKPFVVWTSLDRLLGGPLGLPGLRYTAPDGVEHKDYGGEVLG
jgi:hypothetical protein